MPQWGFAVKDDPEGAVETHLGTPQTWYVFPAWLADRRTAYLEADATASTGNAFAIQRAVVGGEAMPMKRPSVQGAAWSPDGSAVALCVSGDSASLPDEVTIVPLSLAPFATPASEIAAASIPSQPLPSLLATLVGLLSGAYPASRAAQLSPRRAQVRVSDPAHVASGETLRPVSGNPVPRPDASRARIGYTVRVP